MTPEERGEKAASLKKSGTANCCQSVLLAYADSLPMDEEALRRIGAGFAVGMGTMEATCGALVAAGVVAGHRAATRQEAVQLARDIHARFRAKCGATLCKVKYILTKIGAHPGASRNDRTFCLPYPL